MLLQLAFANPAPEVIQKFDNSHFLDKVGSEWVFFSVSEAVQVCTALRNKGAAERSV